MLSTFDYIDSLTTITVKEQLINNMEYIVNELKDEGFDDSDIYEYVKVLLLSILNTDTYAKLNELLNKHQ